MPTLNCCFPICRKEDYEGPQTPLFSVTWLFFFFLHLICKGFVAVIDDVTSIHRDTAGVSGRRLRGSSSALCWGRVQGLGRCNEHWKRDVPKGRRFPFRAFPFSVAPTVYYRIGEFWIILHRFKQSWRRTLSWAVLRSWASQASFGLGPCCRVKRFFIISVGVLRERSNKHQRNKQCNTDFENLSIFF